MVQLFTVEQVSAALQVPVQTLYKWHAKSVGPQALKVGKYLRYRPEAVEAYLASLEPDSNVTRLPQRRAG